MVDRVANKLQSPGMQNVANVMLSQISISEDIDSAMDDLSSLTTTKFRFETTTTGRMSVGSILAEAVARERVHFSNSIAANIALNGSMGAVIACLATATTLSVIVYYALRIFTTSVVSMLGGGMETFEGRQILTGSKGGRYYIGKNGRRNYLSS